MSPLLRLQRICLFLYFPHRHLYIGLVLARFVLEFFLSYYLFHMYTKQTIKKKHLNERPTVRSYIYRQLTIKTWSTNTAYEYDVRLRLTAP